MNGQEVAPQASGLRERNKAKRRSAIIDSTLALLRELPLAEVSIERIATDAEVSPATVYNLIGSKDHLLHACVDRVVGRLVDTLLTIDPEADPVAAATAIVEQSADAFIADHRAYRQIIHALGHAGGDASLTVDPAQLQIVAMRAAQHRALVRDDLDAAALGRQIYLSYNGALFAWAQHLLTDDGFRLAAFHGLWTTLAAAATDAHRTAFVERLRRLGPELTAAGWGRD